MAELVAAALELAGAVLADAVCAGALFAEDEDEGWFAGAAEVFAEATWLADELLAEDEGWLALVPALAVFCAPPWFNAASVCWSSSPEPWMPCACWKAFSAFLVFGPMTPSTAPGS